MSSLTSPATTGRPGHEIPACFVSSPRPVENQDFLLRAYSSSKEARIAWSSNPEAKVARQQAPNGYRAIFDANGVATLKVPSQQGSRLQDMTLPHFQACFGLK